MSHLTEREALILICRDAIHAAAHSGDAHAAVDQMLSGIAEYDREHAPYFSEAGRQTHQRAIHAPRGAYKRRIEAQQNARRSA